MQQTLTPAPIETATEPRLRAVSGGSKRCGWCTEPAKKICEACGRPVCTTHLHSRRVDIDQLIVCPEHKEVR
jgi:hypothetical protein